MTTDVKLVSKEECIWKNLVDNIKRSVRPWIFVDERFAKELKKYSKSIYLMNGSYELRYDDILYPKTRIWIKQYPENGGIWYKIHCMNDMTGFRYDVKNPETILFLKMQ